MLILRGYALPVLETIEPSVEQSRRAAEEFRAPPHHFSLAIL